MSIIACFMFMAFMELYEYIEKNKTKKLIEKILSNANYQTVDLEIITQKYYDEFNDTNFFLVKNAGQLIFIQHHISIPTENKFLHLAGTRGEIYLQRESQWSPFDHPFISVDTDIEGWYIGKSWTKGD